MSQMNRQQTSQKQMTPNTNVSTKFALGICWNGQSETLPEDVEQNQFAVVMLDRYSKIPRVVLTSKTGVSLIVTSVIENWLMQVKSLLLNWPTIDHFLWVRLNNRSVVL